MRPTGGYKCKAWRLKKKRGVAKTKTLKKTLRLLKDGGKAAMLFKMAFTNSDYNIVNRLWK